VFIVNKIPRNRLLRTIKKLQTKRQKEPAENFEEASGCVRPERVNKCPNCMQDSQVMIMMIFVYKDVIS